jgi:hypothetical protein
VTRRLTESHHSQADGVADAVSTVVMLVMGGIGGAAGFTHTRDLAAAHGQPGWLAWAVAVSVELLAVVAGLEIRADRRAARPTRGPFAVLAAGMGLSMAAQVAQAEPSPWGWVTAAVPAASFLIVVKLALRRLGNHPATHTEPAAAPPAAPDRSVKPARLSELPAALVSHGRYLADDHHRRTGRPIDLPALRVGLGVSDDLAAAVLAELPRQDAA